MQRQRLKSLKKFCECFKKHARRKINFKKKKLRLLANGQQESYEKVKNCYISVENFEDKYANDTKYRNNGDHCHYPGEYRSVLNIIFILDNSITNKITVISQNRSNYDYHYVIIEAEKIICLR